MGRYNIGRVGHFVLLASAVALCAQTSNAGDLTITNNRTTTADTATGDGAGPGNIIIQTNGSVSLSGDAAVVLNSNNTVTNNGSISNGLEAGASGVFVLTTTNGAANNITGNVSNVGSINVLGPPSNGPLANGDVFNVGIN